MQKSTFLTLALALCLIIVIGVGCSDDSSPTDSGGTPNPSNLTVKPNFSSWHVLNEALCRFQSTPLNETEIIQDDADSLDFSGLSLSFPAESSQEVYLHKTSTDSVLASMYGNSQIDIGVTYTMSNGELSGISGTIAANAMGRLTWSGGVDYGDGQYTASGRINWDHEIFFSTESQDVELRLAQSGIFSSHSPWVEYTLQRLRPGLTSSDSTLFSEEYYGGNDSASVLVGLLESGRMYRLTVEAGCNESWKSWESGESGDTLSASWAVNFHNPQ